MQSPSSYIALWSHVWSVRLYHSFLHYLIDDTILGWEEIIEHKMCVLICYAFFCLNQFIF